MTVEQMRQAAVALIAATRDPSDRRRLSLARDDPDFRTWTYLPGDRPGLSMEHMGGAQLECVTALVRATHGVVGTGLVDGAVQVERVRRALAAGTPPTGDRYWVRIHGDPASSERWGWRVNGHHLAVHAEVDGDRATLTPHFIGAEPAEVRHGPHAGLRILAGEEDLARALLESLSVRQRGAAVWSSRPPDDILTRADPVADPSRLPEGLSLTGMDVHQRALLERLVRRWLDRAPAAYADACWAEALDSPDAVFFAWAGSPERGRPHYYCLRGPAFLCEYDNTQDDGNHAHSVWRHLRDDFGGDPLGRHYGASHDRSGADR